LQRQRLLRFDDHAADFIDGELVRVARHQGVDVEHMFDRRDAALHPAVAVAQPVLAADRRGFGVEPGERGFEALRRLQRAGCADPIAA
jgi:hypothetical protein